MTSLPAKNLPDDVVDLVAKEVAAQVALHIVSMYPKAANAVSWNSCKLSIAGVIRNNMSRLGKAAESGDLDAEMKKMKLERKRLTAMRKSTEFAFSGGE